MADVSCLHSTNPLHWEEREEYSTVNNLELGLHMYNIFYSTEYFSKFSKLFNKLLDDAWVEWIWNGNGYFGGTDLKHCIPVSYIWQWKVDELMFYVVRVFPSSSATNNWNHKWLKGFGCHNDCQGVCRCHTRGVSEESIMSWWKSQGKHYEESETGVTVASQKRLMSSKL